MRGFDRSLFGVCACLVILAVLLFANQYVTMARFNIFSPAGGFVTLSRFVSATFTYIQFEWLDYSILAFVAAACLLLILGEIRGGRLTSFLRFTCASELRALVFLAGSCLVAVRFYFGSGEFSWAADQPQHISFAHMASRSISEGELPIWTNYLGTGTPYLQFYGFLFFYLAGIVDQIWHDIFATLKTVLATTHIASGLAMYLLVRTSTRSRSAGLIAGLAYVLSFWHTQQVSIMGRFPLSLFYALLPLPFYSFERVVAGVRRPAHALAGGAALGALALTHPGYGFWATFLLGVYVGLRLLLLGGVSRNLFGWVIAIFVGGLLFGGYLTLPMWLEREHTGLYRGFLTLATVPIPTWQHVLAWSNFRFWAIPPPDIDVNWYGGYLGLSLVVIALAGAVSSCMGRSRRLLYPCLPSMTCLTITIVLAFGYKWSLLQAPVVQMLGAGRYLLFTVFFLSLAVGMSAHLLMIVLRKHRLRMPVSTAMLLAIAVDLGPTTFQQPYLRPSATHDLFGRPLALYDLLREQAQEFDSRSQLPNYRVFWSHSEHAYLSQGQLYFNSLTPSPHAPHPGDIRAVFDFVKPVEKYLSVSLGNLVTIGGQELEEIRHFPDRIFNTEHREMIRSALGMLNVRYVMVSDAKRQTIVVDWGSSSPILVSPTLTPFPSDRLDELVSSGDVDAALNSRGLDPEFAQLLVEAYDTLFLLSNSGVDVAGSTCKRIFASDARARRLGTRPQLQLLEHTVSTQRVELRAHVSEPCFARLAYAYYPFLRLSVDGVETEFVRTAGGFMAIEMSAGEHEISIEPYLSPIRRGFLVFDLLYLAVTAGMFVRPQHIRHLRRS